ncbi:MAG: hypothetical protein K8I29_14750 [Alphaproteobacteria bacterium]|uniref:THUMP domain-containing protein n=1 Tax=Candidatus Nitrobium versatile TaxID=2884831 RepID=A0A953JD78_9BACT|nr:hypothetical protein [Candidatus Nitrobium versatile]
MQDWNVVLSVNERGFQEALRKLRIFGPVSKTRFFNVLVMRVDNVPYLLEALRAWNDEDPHFLSFLSRLIPVTRTFVFQTPAEFESRAREAVLEWAAALGGRSFHVRMHRRGFRGSLSSPDEERFLDRALLERLEQGGNPGRISFDSPDIIIALETVEQRAGLSLWTREELQRYPFIRLD